MLRLGIPSQMGESHTRELQISGRTSGLRLERHSTRPGIQSQTGPFNPAKAFQLGPRGLTPNRNAQMPQPRHQRSGRIAFQTEKPQSRQIRHPSSDQAVTASDQTFELRPDMPAQTSNPQTRLPSSGRTFKHKPDIFRRRMQAQTAPDPTFSDKTLQFRQPRPQTSHQNSDWTSQARPDSRKHDIPAQTRRLQTGSSSSGRTATVSDQTSKVRPHPNSDSTNSIAHPTADHRHEPCRVGCRAMPVGRGGGSVLRG